MVQRRSVSVEASNTRPQSIDQSFSLSKLRRCHFERSGGLATVGLATRTLPKDSLPSCHDRRPRSQYVLDVGDTLLAAGLVVVDPAPNAALDA
jgi:hypothetical protein